MHTQAPSFCGREHKNAAKLFPGTPTTRRLKQAVNTLDNKPGGHLKSCLLATGHLTAG